MLSSPTELLLSTSTQAGQLRAQTVVLLCGGLMNLACARRSLDAGQPKQAILLGGDEMGKELRVLVGSKYEAAQRGSAAKSQHLTHQVA